MFLRYPKSGRGGATTKSPLLLPSTLVIQPTLQSRDTKASTRPTSPLPTTNHSPTARNDFRGLDCAK